MFEYVSDERWQCWQDCYLSSFVTMRLLVKNEWEFNGKRRVLVFLMYN